LQTPPLLGTAAQAEQEDDTPPGHSLIFTFLFFCIFFFQKKMLMPVGHLHQFLRETPDISGWLYSELYLGRFQTDGLKNRTLIKKVFVGDRPFFGAF
jgi:hypothetical protein